MVPSPLTRTPPVPQQQFAPPGAVRAGPPPLTNSLGTASFLDSAAANFNHRFYRARQVSK